jgi:hypothetical protein
MRPKNSNLSHFLLSLDFCFYNDFNFSFALTFENCSLSERLTKTGFSSLPAFMHLVKAMFFEEAKSNPSKRAFMSDRKVFLCANESKGKYVTLYVL